MHIITTSTEDWPMRKVFNLALSSDAGFACYQLTCMHLVWNVPKTIQGVDYIRAEREAWRAGRREMYLPCRQCFEHIPPQYPLGVLLPRPLPVKKPHKERVKNLYLKNR